MSPNAIDRAIADMPRRAREAAEAMIEAGGRAYVASADWKRRARAARVLGEVFTDPATEEPVHVEDATPEQMLRAVERCIANIQRSASHDRSAAGRIVPARQLEAGLRALVSQRSAA